MAGLWLGWKRVCVCVYACVTAPALSCVWVWVSSLARGGRMLLLHHHQLSSPPEAGLTAPRGDVVVECHVAQDHGAVDDLQRQAAAAVGGGLRVGLGLRVCGFEFVGLGFGLGLGLRVYAEACSSGRLGLALIKGARQGQVKQLSGRVCWELSTAECRNEATTMRTNNATAAHVVAAENGAGNVECEDGVNIGDLQDEGMCGARGFLGSTRLADGHAKADAAANH